MKIISRIKCWCYYFFCNEFSGGDLPSIAGSNKTIITKHLIPKLTTNYCSSSQPSLEPSTLPSEQLSVIETGIAVKITLISSSRFQFSSLFQVKFPFSIDSSHVC